MRSTQLHNKQAGTLVTFRPYALPDAAWLREEITPRLAARP